MSYKQTLLMCILCLLFMGPGVHIVSAESTPDEELEETKSPLEKILEIHPDYIEIVNSLMFDDFVNNLPSDEFEEAKLIIESEEPNEKTTKLISDYKAQENYQRSHKTMMKKLVKDYHGPDKKARAVGKLQSWLTGKGVDGFVTALKISKIKGSNYLVKYKLDRKKLAYAVNLMTDSVSAVWLEGEGF